MKKKTSIIAIFIIIIAILVLILNQSKIFTNLSLNDTKTSNSTTKLTSATIPTYYVDDDYEIDSEYGWAYKYISGVTEVETFGFTTHSEDYYTCSTSSGYGTFSENIYAVCRITSNSQKGNIGIVYHNVGTYQGQVISLKITVTDWEGFQPAGTCTVDGVTYPSYPYVAFQKTAIACTVSITPAILNPEFKLEFILEDSYVDVNTYDTITIKGHETIRDVDGQSSSSYDYGEYFYMTEYDGIDLMLLTEDSYIEANALKYYGTVRKCEINETEWWLTMLFETDSFSLTYRRGTSREKGYNSSNKQL